MVKHKQDFKNFQAACGKRLLYPGGWFAAASRWKGVTCKRCLARKPPTAGGGE